MVFSSTVFLFGFLPIALFGNFVLLKKTRKGQNLFLTLLSLLFYAWGEPYFVALMILSILMNWFFALLVHRYKDKQRIVRLTLVLTVIYNLGLMFVFKYLTFVVKNMQAVIQSGWFSSISVNIALPIGISFFTFQAMSYVFDVHRGHGQVQKNPMNVALYVVFFPQLIAGPIVRYETIAEQIDNRRETFKDFSEGIQRFIVGFAKKIILANNFAILADSAFAAKSPSAGFAWVGIFAYAFQIFFDFSAYSDMAIGLGKMFGFHFLENFDYPYISSSVSEFWRRWHISLGTWFRDYLYFPLGGSRVKSKGRLVFNLFVVWFLTGVWHGANWTFVVWGLMYFVLITTEKLTGFEKKLGKFGHVYTLLFVLIGWVLFRANNLTEAWQYLGHMFGIGNALWDASALFYLRENAWFFAAGVLFSMPIAPWLSKKFKAGRSPMPRHAADLINLILSMIVFLIALTYMVKGAYNPFIYFNF